MCTFVTHFTDEESEEQRSLCRWSRVRKWQSVSLWRLPFPHISFFKKINLFIYLFIHLFLAVLGLRCCAQAFSSWGEQGLLFVAVRGLLIAVASLVAEHRL